MQHELHPIRYKETMDAANQRFHDIVIDNDRPERLVAEVVGITQAEMGTCRERLNRLESCIVLWAENGKSVLDTTTLPNGLLLAEAAPFDIDATLLDRSVYVHFGLQKDFRFHEPSGDGIDGFYVRKVVEASAYELIFVCGGPEWSELEKAPYSDVLRRASRIAALRLEIGAPFSPAFARDTSMCDPGLLDESALGRSVSAAGVVLSILASKNRDVLGAATRTVH